LTRTVSSRKHGRPEAKDYRSFSFWLETAGEDLTPRPSLPGPTEADVAIVGAGFTGLWTAYYLLQQDPSLRVVVLEAEISGFGASGRNGAWCNSAFPVTPPELARRFGKEATKGLLLEMRGAVDEIGRVAEAEGIDAQYYRGGQLRVARGPAQVPAIEDAYRSAQALGLEGDLRLLDAGETAGRVRITGAKGSLYNPHCATIHPARLARGYTGQGVATANLSGRTLADLILGRDNIVTALPTVNHEPRPWEPEPWRWLGARYVQRGLAKVDDHAEQTGEPPTGKTLAERLGSH
jgi:glycine/D-amino acid oxidase-like deaminating enzyme